MNKPDDAISKPTGVPAASKKHDLSYVTRNFGHRNEEEPRVQIIKESLKLQSFREAGRHVKILAYGRGCDHTIKGAVLLGFFCPGLSDHRCFFWFA